MSKSKHVVVSKELHGELFLLRIRMDFHSIEETIRFLFYKAGLKPIEFTEVKR